ncbi:glycosyltransferase [Salsuginibacillus kocurii]|uniref:glycosyltransferase n=1 Tax=Salsuginibacillus kocurii TaxID=427078 RepID=UPI00036FFD56|nr:glycosyltransferase [Salsuginibacillus kocurii]
MKKTIAHFLYKGVKPHQEFVYHQISKLKNYRSIVIGPYQEQDNFYPFAEFYNLNDIGNLAEFLKEQNVVAIHSHHGGESLKILPKIKELDIPFIVSIRGRDGSAHKNAFDRNFNRYKDLKNYGTVLFPVCQYLADDMKKLGFPEKKLKVLYGGIDLDHFPFVEHQLPEKGEVRIVSVGRLVMKKGFDTLIEAFAKVHQNHPNTTLHIIGEGENQKELKSLIKKKKLKNVIKLRGRLSTEEIANEIQNAHIFCLASQIASDGDVEGIPNALKEAMASGTPVVSTEHGGIPELVRHKETGFLATERNPHQLAQGIEFFLENPDIWKDYTEKARLVIEENFDLDTQINVQECYYDAVVDHQD